MACSKIFLGDLPELINKIIQYFHYDYKTLHSYPFSIKFPKNYSFIDTYLCILNEDRKAKFDEYGINDKLLPSNNRLFNYPSFIKYLYTDKIFCSIKYWVNKNYDNMDLILQNPNLICNIRNLNLNGYAIPFQDFIPLLKFLYSNCNSISSIIFKFPEVNFNINNYSLVEECLTQMIVSQHNLKKISFGIFYNLNLYNPVFDHLNVLESIHLINCDYLNSNFVQQIIKVIKPFKLKSLIIHEILHIESLLLLLQKCGDYLENIRYFYTNVLDDNNIYLIIKNNQHNINYLTIAVKFYEYDTVYNELSSTVLKNLGQILPPKLKYLCLVLLFNTSDLEIFLKNSQNTFIKKLLIRNIVMYGDGDGDFNILFYIKKYIMKKERVKYLAILEEDELFFPKKKK
ncbi:hypothetical protein RhiirC2_792009 [Rhizophagus irregularis]|uniref:F-box domain-containing protein n=1 Tax=Rhizophagus irregularis TaxID=588596 RepID=A0A2N1MI54_9GLOM|nr:hypothetical protein RhiirC2_792009 [Rhizophagus irregularis]